LGWHLKVIHVTWTQFGKKRTRFQLYTKIDIKRAYNAWRRRHDSLRRRQKAQAMVSEIFETASEEADLKKPIEDSAGRRRQRGDGVTIIKRRRQDLHRDGIRDPATASRRGRLKVDLESSTWRWRHNSKVTPSHRLLEDIPSSNTTKIEYLYTSGRQNAIKDKVQAQKCKCGSHLSLVRRTSPQVNGIKDLDN
ncbi:hypothetical protein Tco_1161559, partial [Tanacetum coccineum]